MGAGKTVYPSDDALHDTGALGEAFYDAVTYRLYKYTENLNSSRHLAAHHQGMGSDEMIVSAWNDDADTGGQTALSQLLGAAGPQDQSRQGQDGDAGQRPIPARRPSRAVDGNTDGNYNNGSVAITGSALNPWWKVDLGETCYIDAVDVWNRTDGCDRPD